MNLPDELDPDFTKEELADCDLETLHALVEEEMGVRRGDTFGYPAELHDDMRRDLVYRAVTPAFGEFIEVIEGRGTVEQEADKNLDIKQVYAAWKRGELVPFKRTVTVEPRLPDGVTN